MAPKKRGMDVLDDLCGEDSDDSSAGEPSAPPQKKPAAGGASKLSVAALERAGYTAGPSVMHVPEQRSTEPQGAWEWSQGRTQEPEEAGPSAAVRARSPMGTSAGAEAASPLAMQLQPLA